MKGVYLKKGNTKVSVVPYYRVGDLFLTTIATNPSNFLGGKWELFGPGRCLVCVDTSQTEFNSVKKTGGAKARATGNHTLTINEMPSHRHIGLSWLGDDINQSITLNGGNSGKGYNLQYYGQYVPGQEANIQTRATGGGGAHNHGNLNVLQPYITCYIWIRTA